MKAVVASTLNANEFEELKKFDTLRGDRNPSLIRGLINFSEIVDLWDSNQGRWVFNDSERCMNTWDDLYVLLKDFFLLD